MLNEITQEKIQNVFYSEAPYDYVLEFVNRKPKTVAGICHWGQKIVEVYTQQPYDNILFTILHEIAHANMSNVTQTHSEVWEQEFVRLLKKYNVSKKAANHFVIGHNIREWMNV